MGSVGSCLTPTLSFPHSHFRSIEPGLKEDTLEFLKKVVSRHSQELSSILDDAALSGSDRSAHLNALKMNCYALIRLLESFENMTSQTSLIDLDIGGKGKRARAKATLGFDWEEERQPVLQLLTQLLQLDIRHLWNHSAIEEEFVRWGVRTQLEQMILSRAKCGSGAR